ncbi:MAG: aldehyde dehydrogenase, partial [Bacteroidales bacterium]
MSLEERIKSFAVLGEILRNVLNGISGNYGEQLNALIDNQYKLNPWFTPENVRMAVKAIAGELTEENLIKWTNAYPELKKNITPVKAGLIMAGNIPLVGFHDYLSVLISGNKLIAKTSLKDSELIVCINDILNKVNPEFKELVEFTEGTLSNFDVVIATGSDNSSRYFEYYFGKYPNIIRKNRNSIAVLEGDETDAELQGLGTDIFSYFGLGCRNVSKIYLPKGYDLSAMIRNWDAFAGSINHVKYANNYDFNKAVYLV